MSDDVVMYTFAGRRKNMELQMPLYLRVLEENPNVVLDIWNLTKYYADNEYVKRLREPGRRLHSRIRVRDDFQHINPWWARFDPVWRYYTKSEYQGTQFVKLDDDVVFFQAHRFADFVEAARQAPGTISSALTINNGASIRHTPGMSAPFKKLGIPLLDVHEHGEFATFSHDFALAHWDKLLHMPFKSVATKDWLSINMISYDWDTGRQVVDPLGYPPPLEIAGRTFRADSVVGDEGACNMLPRQIVKGFLAAHLTFGPQELPKEEWDLYRRRYGEAGKVYLEH